MNTDSDFAFLKSKTEALCTALFYNFSNWLLRFPTSLIKLIKFDEEANVSFEIKKPYEDISDMDRRFPAQLNFYKKGFSCYTKLHGIATISPEEKTRGMISIKFEITNAECFYNNTKTSSLLINLSNPVSYFLKSLYMDQPNYLNIALNNARFNKNTISS